MLKSNYNKHCINCGKNGHNYHNCNKPIISIGIIAIKKIENKFILKKELSNKFVNIYRPDIKNNKKNGWQGRLCWETPFICSYNNLAVYKKYGYLIINKLEN